MLDVEDLKSRLRTILRHLYDPTFPFDEGLAAILGVPPRLGMSEVQAVLVQRIRALEPGPAVPKSARAWRLYDLLCLRYLEQLTQEATAARLAITARHVAREQDQAIELMARSLWKVASPTGPETREAEGDSPFASPVGVPDPSALNQQVEEELASLQGHMPKVEVDVGDVLQEVVDLTQVLAARYGATLLLSCSHASLTAKAHPAVLREVFVAAISYLARNSPQGDIDVAAREIQGEIIVTMSAGPTAAKPPSAAWLGRELLASQAGKMECRREGNRLAFHLTMPLGREATVLVIDDNEDLAHFYDLCTAGTGYTVATLTDGQRVFETIEAVRPDVIVLDIMLPGVDGWTLLTQLHEHPLSRAIPIVVCSVIREDELAYALGAAVCVAKPVRRRQFIEALDRAMDRG